MGQVDAQEVNAASGTNRFVVWQDVSGAGPFDVFFRRSTDDGATWQPSVNLSNNPGSSTNPKIAVSGASVFVAWSQGNADNTKSDILLKRSTNNGQTWSGNIKITPGGTCSATSCHAIESLTASGTNVFLVTSMSGDIFLRRSSDNGATWKSPVNLSSNAGRSFDPDIAVSGTNIYISWTQADTANTSFDILFRRSMDNGATWKSKVNLSKDPAFSEEAEVAASGSNVYVVWDGEVTGVDDRIFLGIKFKRSVDGGATWSGVQEISTPPAEEINDEWPMGARIPQIVATGSFVYLAWQDNVLAEGDKDGQGDMLFRRSVDSGASWDSSVDLGHWDNNDNPTNCSYFKLAAAGPNVYLAWAHQSSCGDSYQITFNHSTDNGDTWSPGDTMGDTFSFGARRDTQMEIAGSGSAVLMVITRVMSGPGTDIFLARSTNSGDSWALATNLSKTPGQSHSPMFGL
jgi:hypothetical protein